MQAICCLPLRIINLGFVNDDCGNPSEILYLQPILCLQDHIVAEYFLDRSNHCMPMKPICSICLSSFCQSICFMCNYFGWAHLYIIEVTMNFPCSTAVG